MKLDLTDEEVELVFQGIQNLPFKQVAGLITKIQTQFSECHQVKDSSQMEPTQVDSTHIKK